MCRQQDDVMADSDAVSYQNECLGCHSNSSTNGMTAGPQLGGLSKRYVLDQLRAFKYGWRSTGNPAAESMTDAIRDYKDRDLEDMARWVSNIESESIFDYSSDQGSTGYQIYMEQCKGCHESAIARYITGSPKLKSLDADYIIGQLHFFEKGLRGFDNPTKYQLKMKSVVETLSDNEFEALKLFVSNASLNTGENPDE